MADVKTNIEELEEVSAEKAREVEEMFETPKTNTSAASLKVYKKKSTFPGAKDTDFWYSATLSNGNSVICKFKCGIPDDINKLLAFEIANVVGTCKKKEVEVKGEKYTNYTYYITSCDFREIVGEELPL